MTSTTRLSRHIPDREAMDYEVASFNLETNESFCVAMDSTATASLTYNQKLATQLGHITGNNILHFSSNEEGGDCGVHGSNHATNGSTASGPPRGILTSHSLAQLPKNTFVRKSASRIMNSNPERVLDAPDLGYSFSQMIEWGDNNQIVIGLRNKLYNWDANTGNASEMWAISPELNIIAVQWLVKSTSCAAVLDDGRVLIYDPRAKKFLRQVPSPNDSLITCIASNGPIMAAASAGPQGNIFVYDLRCKDPLTNNLEAHAEKVTALNFRKQDPFYLASGGADGAIKIWDFRKPNFPHMSFSGLHRKDVSCLCWNPRQSHLLHSGGLDGKMYLLNLHKAVPTDASPNRNVPGFSSTSNIAAVEQEVKCDSPITGLIADSKVGEILSAHGKGAGNLQLRSISNYGNLLGTFSSPNCSEPIACVSLAPDKETICAAQQDETLKFWKVFDAKSDRKRKRETSNANVGFDHEIIR